MFADYRDNLFLQLEKCLSENVQLSARSPKTPTLASRGIQIDKQEIIRRQRVRGTKRKAFTPLIKLMDTSSDT